MEALMMGDLTKPCLMLTHGGGKSCEALRSITWHHLDLVTLQKQDINAQVEEWYRKWKWHIVKWKFTSIDMYGDGGIGISLPSLWGTFCCNVNMIFGWSCHWWRSHVARLWDYILGEVWLMVKGGDDEESALKDVERDDEENEKEDNY